MTSRQLRGQSYTGQLVNSKQLDFRKYFKVLQETVCRVNECVLAVRDLSVCLTLLPDQLKDLLVRLLLTLRPGEPQRGGGERVWGRGQLQPEHLVTRGLLGRQAAARVLLYAPDDEVLQRDMITLYSLTLSTMDTFLFFHSRKFPLIY